MTKGAALSLPFWLKEVKFFAELAFALGKMKSSISALLSPEWLLGKVHGLLLVLCLQTNYSFLFAVPFLFPPSNFHERIESISRTIRLTTHQRG